MRGIPRSLTDESNGSDECDGIRWNNQPFLDRLLKASKGTKANESKAGILVRVAKVSIPVALMFNLQLGWFGPKFKHDKEPLPEACGARNCTRHCGFALNTLDWAISALVLHRKETKKSLAYL